MLRQSSFIGRGCGRRRKRVLLSQERVCPRGRGAGSREAAILRIWPTLGWYTTYGGEKHGLGAPKMMLSGGHRRSPGTLSWSFGPVLPSWLWVEPITLLGASPHLLYRGPHPEIVPRDAIQRTFAPCPSHHRSFSPVPKRANPDVVKMLCLKAPLKRCQG